jgi:hypothetical protein
MMEIEDKRNHMGAALGLHYRIGKLMSQEPYKSARRVFWIMDNCSAHRWTEGCRPLPRQMPNAITFGGTHYVTPRALTAAIGFHFYRTRRLQALCRLREASR